jgi:hypothetical protein
MEKQYIYILSNADKPEIVKVGMTKKHPEVRADKLTNGTGSTGKWQVEWSMVVPDCRGAEKIAHVLLAKFHQEGDKRENFRITVFEASSIIEKKLIEFFEIEKAEMWESEELKKEKEKQYKLTIAKALLAKAKINLEKALQ